VGQMGQEKRTGEIKINTIFLMEPVTGTGNLGGLGLVEMLQKTL